MAPPTHVFLHVFLLLAVTSAAPPSSPPPRTNLPTKHAFTPNQPFCHALLKNPQPLTADCNQSPQTKKCVDGSYKLFSQMRQDYYVYTNHFANLKRRGVYVDVATNDPIRISNTYFMDACLGWSGLCVEAHPGFIQSIHQQRSCAVLPTCVSDKHGTTVEFVLEGGASGVKHTNKHMKKWRDMKRTLSSIVQECTTLGAELRKWDVSVVDYMSLDVEGHELLVLKGIDWRKVRFNVMTVEVTRESLPGVEGFLKGKGYVRHFPEIQGPERNGLLNEDAVFLHKDVVWGKPQ